MANRQKSCDGKKSDSLCTCNSNPECQDDTNASNHDRNYNDTNSVYSKQNNECSSQCMNCKLLNQLYMLLEKMVDNRKKDAEEPKKSRYDNDTRISLKNNNEETPKIKENLKRLPNRDMDDKKCKVCNVNSNNTGPNKLTLYDQTLNCCECKKKEHTLEVLKTKENKRRCSAQDWHSVGQIKKQNQVDIACQCTFPKKDSGTQEEAISENNNKDLNKFVCTDSAVNTYTQTQNNSCCQNLVCSLTNDPMFREVIKLMQCPNVVVLSNGCSCCNKCNTPLERTSVTTNTSDIIVNQQELNTTQILKDVSQENSVAFQKNIVPSREPSIPNNDNNFINPASNIISERLKSIYRSSNEIPRQSVNNNDILRDTTFMIPEETNFTVASAIVAKSGKKKATPKSKKRKGKMSSASKHSDTSDKKDSISICCQTDKKLTEEKCELVVPDPKNFKDTGVCCDMNKCNTLPPKLCGKDSMKNTAINNQNINSCNCTDIRNFITVITELCAQINKTKEKSDGIVVCECSGQQTSTKTPVAPKVIPVAPAVTPVAPNDCFEIHRLAEKIAEIHLKSNQNKNCSPNSMSSNEIRGSTNSDCDLTNCIHKNPINIAPDNTEQCYCKICPCKKTTKYDRKDVCPVKKERKCRSSINPTPRRASKKNNDMEFSNLNKWTQQYPSPQKCTCSNYECMEEAEVGYLNYNISDYSKDSDNCELETCPQLRRIVKDCLCGSKNCYCHNAKLNELKTTAKLERLADEVINTITPCNCLGQQCTCTNNAMDPGRRYTSR